MSERIQARRAATIASIIDAAWDMAREEGLGGISLRKLAARMGMRAPSLYSYFDSKDQIYDAMFERGNVEFLASFKDASPPDPNDPHATLSEFARIFIEFCEQDVARFQFLFQAGVPGWHPSEKAYAPAVQVIEELRERLAALGFGDERAIDLWTALLSGLTHQQIANDPGGDRWKRLIDDGVTMFLLGQGWTK